MNAWNSVLIAITSNVLVISVLGFLAKSLIEKFIARESKQFEIELKAKYDATAEQLKNALQLRTIEHQVKFSKLHEKRAEVIAELYRKLRTALWDAELFLSPIQFAGGPEQSEMYRTAFNSLVEAYRFFGEHQIYLPAKLCISLEELLRDARSEVIKLGVWLGYKAEGLPDHAHKARQETWLAGWQRITNEIPIATRALEDEFRALLGAEIQSHSLHRVEPKT